MKSIVLGGTGSVGRNLIQFMVNSPKYQTIFLPVRHVLPEWTSLSPEKKGKLKIIEVPDLNFLSYPTTQLVQYFGNEKTDKRAQARFQLRNEPRQGISENDSNTN